MKLILIGGAPRTGKTTLAQQIATNLGISWVSTDALESIVYEFTPESKRVARFPKSVMRKNTNRSNDEFYERYSISEIVDAYEVQSETVSKAISSLAAYAEKEGWGYVIEGYHITPALISSIRDKGIECASVVLVNSDPADVVARSKNSAVKNDWIRDNTKNEETYEKICAGIQEHSARLIKCATACDVPYVDMAENFQAKTAQAYELLTA